MNNRNQPAWPGRAPGAEAPPASIPDLSPTNKDLPPPGLGGAPQKEPLQVILSFDVEEHHRIEAAAGLPADPARNAYYQGRVGLATRWLLDELGGRGIRATFFVVGQIARDQPDLVRAIHRGGHELASHSWDHRRLLHHTPGTFYEDVRRSKDAIEQVTGVPVLGYRAPTFSIVRQTAWALDVLAELDILYDSSIYPVRHDLYGLPGAPRGPFLARGARHWLLEFPPATLGVPGLNLPTGGGGYFRLLPSWFLRKTLQQVERRCRPPVAMLYFHPWEFDADQARLPLRGLRRFRTYVGIGRTRARLAALLDHHRFVSAAEVAQRLGRRLVNLPCYQVAVGGPAQEVGPLPRGEVAAQCSPS
jgi:polysaccharide deacetylase family protein (PEP-CTERM system associated)